MTKSGGSWPATSVMEINSFAGVPLNKIVIGKPLDTGAADNGYMSPSSLATCVKQGQNLGWNGGVMFWEWTSVCISLPSPAFIHLGTMIMCMEKADNWIRRLQVSWLLFGDDGIQENA